MMVYESIHKRIVWVCALVISHVLKLFFFFVAHLLVESRKCKHLLND